MEAMSISLVDAGAASKPPGPVSSMGSVCSEGNSTDASLPLPASPLLGDGESHKARGSCADHAGAASAGLAESAQAGVVVEASSADVTACDPHGELDGEPDGDDEGLESHVEGAAVSATPVLAAAAAACGSSAGISNPAAPVMSVGTLNFSTAGGVGSAAGASPETDVSLHSS